MAGMTIKPGLHFGPDRPGPMPQSPKPVSVPSPIPIWRHLKLTWRFSILAIDVGTESTRVTLCYHDGVKDVFIDVPGPNGSNAPNGCEFPGVISLPNNLSDDGSGLGVERTIPTKYLIYQFAKSSTSFQETTNIIIPEKIADRIQTTFLNEMNSGEVLWRFQVLEKILPLIEEYFTKIGTMVASFCQEHGHIVTSVVATHPYRDSTALQEIYLQLLRAMAPTAPKWMNAFSSVEETHALGHYLLHHPSRWADVGGEKPDRLLVLDFGAHCLRTAVFHLNWKTSKDGSFKIPDFYSIDTGTEHKNISSPDAYGGVDYHAYLIEQTIRSDLGGENMTPDEADKLETIVKAMMAHFHEKLKQKQIGEEVFQLRGANHTWKCNANGSRKHFYGAYFQALVTIYRYLTNMCRLKGGRKVKTTMVLTGSSFKNKSVLKLVTDLIQDWQVTGGGKLSFFHAHNQGDFPSTATARGTALAKMYQKTVRQFLDEGAAFALQSQPPTAIETSSLLLHNGKSNKVKVRKGTPRITIVCKPRYASDDGNRLKAKDGTYTLCHLPIIASDRANEYTLSYPNSEPGRGEFLILDVISTGAGAIPGPVHHRFKIPVHMDPGGRILKMDADYEL
ncbi:hypothetical protein BDP55DRAFT_754743 [Colletotrichum godetiae]|uniref:Uncharacterized protein n=1 Tax=Colletotrichum godetiae TaxID=1209918 RepID=A0AAJ0ENM0_9PEZI|nr:uncharacterized protein BDP55DRAFT_754743 [Colletotrichum godetiae]KAK1659985.1 hypothetical protein BDP55DRAFT_754743 [Colletotrichum godetiae]